MKTDEHPIDVESKDTNISLVMNQKDLNLVDIESKAIDIPLVLYHK
jgi:hypothetical protein